ncbi:MAG: hypothetical protein V7723_17310 [Sneathiella sp.]|uniref:hypothetical protein n=1 Tax=Sneathiella sp. TaxID=1964365 RepID=UPI0030010206
MSSATALKSPLQENCAHFSDNPVCFTITAEIDPSTLPRILENFALRNLVPHKLQSTRIDDYLAVSVSISGLSVQEIAHLELRIQNILPVQTVNIDHR